MTTRNQAAKKAVSRRRCCTYLSQKGTWSPFFFSCGQFRAAGSAGPRLRRGVSELLKPAAMATAVVFGRPRASKPPRSCPTAEARQDRLGLMPTGRSLLRLVRTLLW